jgi:hypothetical protein
MDFWPWSGPRRRAKMALPARSVHRPGAASYREKPRMRRTATTRLTSPACGTPALVAFVVVFTVILSCVGFALGPVPAAFAQIPAQVTLDGEWELNRREHDPCIVAVPEVLRGTIHVEADFVAGTVTGSFEGGGAGSYTMPAGCKHENPDEYDFSHLETWTADVPVVQATFSGTLDRITGAFDMDAVVYAEGEGYRAAPGSTYVCGTDSRTPTCDLGSFAGDQSAEVYGIITPTGVNRGGFDWYTNYTALVSPGSIDWGPHGMTGGSWTAEVTDVVWRENRAPEVGGIVSSPADPTTDDAIVFTVEATDPDEDTLTYAWYIDGAREGPSAPSVTWAKPTAGDHVIKVTVSDGGDSVDAFLDLRVSEHVGAGDQDGDGLVDDEDRCPDEWGEGDDGCPPLAAAVYCTPATLTAGDALVCRAKLVGVKVDEAFSFDWYLNGGNVQSGRSATWTWGSAEDGTHEIAVDALGDARSTSAGYTFDVGEVGASEEGSDDDEKIDPVAQLGAAAVTAFLAGGWAWAEYLRAQREGGRITADEEAKLAALKPPGTSEDEVEFDYGDEETPEEMAARRAATGRRDIEEFMTKRPEYRRIYPKLFKADGSIDQVALAAMMAHYEKYGPNSEYAAQYAEEQKALRRFIDGFFEKHVRLWEYQDKVERPDGTIDRALLRKLVIWQRKYGDPEPKESPYAWVADGLTGTMKEVFTGIEEDGTTSWSAMVLRGLVGFATAGQSEWIYVPGDSMFRFKNGVDRGQEGLELYGRVAGGVVFDEVLGRAIGKGIEKGAGAAAKRWPGMAKSVVELFDETSAKLNRPLFGAGKPAPLSAGMDAFKRQVVEAADSGDDAALRQFFKNKGMKKLAQLEAGGHLNASQAAKIVSVHDDITRAAVRRGTVDAIDEFGKVHGVKPKEVMVGNSGSVGPHRSVLTDADRTVVATFGDEALTAHARANNQYRFDVAPDGAAAATPDTAWAARDLQGKLTSLHSKHVELNLNGADDFVTQHARKTGKTLGEAFKDLEAKGFDVDAGSGTRLNAADMDTASYSGFGSGAGPADSYPSGFTQARQAIQGETEVFRVQADGTVAKPYKTSGQAIIDQNALNVRPASGSLPADPTRISVGEMKPLLDQQRTAVGNYTDPKSIAKAIDRANYVAGRTNAPLPNQNLVDASIQIRANPTATNRILANHGLNEQQFVNATKDMMNGYNPNLK